ncbi:MAG: UvrD-helicase domain-containing protein, partial [Bacteroidales bacterium]
INDGNGWNSSEESIKRLSAQLFKEDYKEWRNSLSEEALPTKDEINQYNTRLREVIKSFEDELRLICDGAVSILKDVDIEELYKKTKSPLNYFSKGGQKVEPPTKTFCEFAEIEDKWLQPGASEHAAEVMRKIKEGDYVGRVVALFRDNYSLYVTARKISKNLYSFGILSDIDNHVREIERERNIMLLSDTTELLNKIIDGSDTPFVYEKSGSYIKHYMIDEFQDTSRLQWKNFSPLINESIASGGSNLIVGDVKQSIYRWRNSDWRLLNGSLATEKSLRSSDIDECGLDTNWRSTKNIVEFNNLFFTKAVDLLKEGIEDAAFQEEFQSAYHDVVQKLPTNNKRVGSGYIDATLFLLENKDDFKAQALSRLYDDICRLLENGVSAGDIAILVRAKSDLRLIAEYLLKRQTENSGREFYIISDEALLINNSGSVRAIISMLRYVHDPDSRNNELIAKYEYALIKGSIACDALSAAFGYMLHDNS